MKRAIIFSLFLCLTLFVSLEAQYNINEKIEAEDLYESRVVAGSDAPAGEGTDWLRVGHGEGWVPHPTEVEEWYPSEFIYVICGNRHWLCNYDVVERCWEACADVYVSATVNIPEEGDYIIYAYVANWADSAVLVDNRGCGRDDKQECGAWFLAWDDPGKLDKVYAGSEWNVPKDYIWKTYPYDEFCQQFDLDTVSLGHDKLECPGTDPRECDFPATRFHLTAGEHTIYLKASEEYTLLDWLWVAKDGDPGPAAEPGRPWDQGSNINTRNVIRPEQFVLEQNFPNPFNALTTINFYLPRTSNVELSVYNVTGQKIANLVNSIQPRGHHSVSFDASGLSSGTYLYKFRASCTTCGGKEVPLFSQVKDMVLVK
jgi:hypothetical protein